MKTIFAVLLLSVNCLAQTGRVPTVTRTVQLFGELERKLEHASPAAKAQMVAVDFEERLCAAPGTPVPREDWLQKVPVSNVTFSQEAVHMYEGIAVYSGLRSWEGSNPQSIVDVWRQRNGTWKLSVRYGCPVPGAGPADSTIPKRY